MAKIQEQISSAIESANSIFQKAIERVNDAINSILKMKQELLSNKPLLQAEVDKRSEQIASLQQEIINIKGNFTIIDDQVKTIEDKIAELEAQKQKIQQFIVSI